jgi:hypothetical protein
MSEQIEEAATTPITVPAKIARSALGKVCLRASSPTAIMAMVKLVRMMRNLVLTSATLAVRKLPKIVLAFLRVLPL